MTLPLLYPDDPAAAARIDALCRRGVSPDEKIAAAAREILADVRARGDAALRELTRRFEGRELVDIELSRASWDAEAAKVAPDVVAALERAEQRVRAFHERQREHGYELHDGGARLALRVEPLARVGLYVPGGTARYPSSVIMTAVPARVAGVGEIAMVTPGPSPETLAAAKLAGVDRVFVIGGAQAIAALAYGTETVPRVDKIVGPGNAWVAEAKRLVFGEVDIDTVAGPSEVLIVADESADAALVAADLLAQAEHDTAAVPVLVTTSEVLAAQVKREVERQLAELPRRAIAERSLADNGAAIVVRDLREAIRIANRFAPEHLELHVADAAHVAEHIRSAGAIFVGPYTPEAAGDYLAGPNHVLPTAGAARYASPLGTYDFVKRISVLEYDFDTLRGQAADISRLARVEGLHAHARSVAIRLERNALRQSAAARDPDPEETP
jgi:histidinol dehydrogenase